MMRHSLVAICVLNAVAVLAQEPPAPPQPRQAKVQTKHFYSVQTPDEKIEVEESQPGKDIVLRREHRVNGELKKEEFKAPDLEALKKLNADAADAYRRATQQRIPIRPPQPMFAPNMMPQFGVPTAQQPGPGQGVRKINATVRGQKVRISDQYGARIEIAVTQTRDGEDDTETYSAADFAVLKREHPDVAALYQKLTGTN